MSRVDASASCFVAIPGQAQPAAALALNYLNNQFWGASLRCRDVVVDPSVNAHGDSLRNQPIKLMSILEADIV